MRFGAAIRRVKPGSELGTLADLDNDHDVADENGEVRNELEEDDFAPEYI